MLPDVSPVKRMVTFLVSERSHPTREHMKRLSNVNKKDFNMMSFMNSKSLGRITYNIYNLFSIIEDEIQEY